MGSVGLAAIGCRRALSTPGRALALTSVVGLLTLACGGGTEKTRSTGGTPGVSTGGVVGDGGSMGTTGGTGSGTATGGTDFTGLPVTVTIPDGKTTATATIPVTDDTDAEPDETINLAISAPTNLGCSGRPRR